MKLNPWLIVILCMLALSPVTTHAATLHVSASAPAQGDGSRQAPFNTIKGAIDAAVAAGDASEIIIHAGVYPGEVTFPAPAAGTDAAKVPAWTVRAATATNGDFEQVIIDGGQKITEADVIDAERGIYFIRFPVANFEPSMWEAQNRIRYIFVGDRRSVEAFPGTLTPERDGILFRTSDNRPPAAHDLGLARDRLGFIVLRPNVTIKGLRFHNFQLYFGVHGVSIQAANVTVDSCHAWNCYGLVGVSEEVPDAKIINCTARDVATGVKSYGLNTSVDKCRFFRIEDAFVVQENEQDQCGIQFYTSKVQTARDNLCVGFQAGIFIKASSGVATLERNTVIAGRSNGDRGIGPNKWRAGSVCRDNVVVGYQEPLSLGDGLSKEIDIRGNVIWLAAIANQKRMNETIEVIKEKAGGENIVAPPQFINESKEDFRLSAQSAGAKPGVDGRAAGAMGVALASEADITPPVLQIELQEPAQPMGTRSQIYLRKNTWIGGKEPELIEDRLMSSDHMTWLAPKSSVQVRLQAADSQGQVKQVRHRLGKGEWSKAQPFAESIKIELTGSDKTTSLAVQVADGAGNWSEPATTLVAIAEREPKLLSPPVIHASEQGAIIAFKSDAPCVASLEWGTGNKLDQRAQDQKDTRFRYDNDLGLEWTEQISGPTTDHCLVVMAPAKAGQTYRFRVLLGYNSDQQAVVHEGDFTLKGPARTLHVATNGADAESNGDKDKPLASLQFAVDRTLPGDRVLVAPGIYTGSVSVRHGGVAGHPIRIESAEPWTAPSGGAVLDGRREFGAAIHLNDVNHVQISGFEMRWYLNALVLAHNTEDVVVEHCKMWDRLWVKGRPSSNDGVVFFTGRRATLNHNVFFALNSAFRIFDFDQVRITNNTAVRCFHRVASIAYSDHCYLRNNSFAFGSSYLLSLVMTDEQMSHFDSDYNNLAVHLREDVIASLGKTGRTVPPEELLTREDNDFYYGESKGLSDLSSHKADHSLSHSAGSLTLTSWRQNTGQDKHSIAVHPRYVDPRNRDFRLLPKSPNLGKGENGANIGALGAASPDVK